MRITPLTLILAMAALGAGALAAAASGTITYQQTDDEGLSHLLSGPAAGGVATQLTTRATAHDPTPVSKADEGGSFQLYVMDADGGNRRSITNNLTEPAGFVWAR